MTLKEPVELLFQSYKQVSEFNASFSYFGADAPVRNPVTKGRDTSPCNHS